MDLVWIRVMQEAEQPKACNKYAQIRGVAVVEWSSSGPLDCEVRGSNPGQGRNLKTKISASGAPQRW